MPRKMVNWGPVPGRRHIQGQAWTDTDTAAWGQTSEELDDQTEVPTDGKTEAISAPKPDESFSNKPTYCSTVGKTSKRYSGGGL